MAYAQSALSVAQYTIAGRRHWKISYTETGVDTAVDGTADATVSGLPHFCTLLAIKATLTGGTGTTINPKLGHASGFAASTQNHIGTAASTAAHINEQGATYFYTSSGSIYVRSSPDAAADNAVSVELLICEGAP
jgi:hypothetical protein